MNVGEYRREITNGQSRETGNFGHRRHITKRNTTNNITQKTKKMSITNPTKNQERIQASGKGKQACLRQCSRHEWGSCYSIFSCMCMFVDCCLSFCHFPLAIALSVILFKNSDYSFNIFKRFLIKVDIKFGGHDTFLGISSIM